MVEVYYYMPSAEVPQAVECGMKLSRWFDKEIDFGDGNKKCISALLNPKDNLGKYKSEEFKCVKFELSPIYCFVADAYLYKVGQNFPEVLEAYKNSIIPVEKYIFGTYRMPECLVTTTVIAGQIILLDKRLDSPILYTNSEELYINNIIETYKEEQTDFNDTMLYHFYCRLAEMGKVIKIEDRKENMAVFCDTESGRAYTIKIPDMSKY
ncbi:MAG: hypothetical protein Q8920_06615 [Bacillota bacterium]|nr:hypothetical protein [Bacillota bacterium]